MNGSCTVQTFVSYRDSIPRILQAIGAPAVFARQRRIVIKPNLVNATPPPVTLPVALAESLVESIRSATSAKILIAEGTGDRDRTTEEIFRIHGYRDLADRLDIPLVDLNTAPLTRLENPACEVFSTFMLPELLLDSFLISAAVLKAHSLADVTLSMKNMIGCAPPRYYQQGGHWKKSAFHARMHEAIFDLNRYRCPDLALVDGSIGLSEHHLGGPCCEPPVNRLLAGFDPVAVDAAGAALLGRHWSEVEHIRMADGVLGKAGPEGVG